MKRAITAVTHGVWVSFLAVGWWEGTGTETLTAHTQVIAVYALLGSLAGLGGAGLRLGLEWSADRATKALRVGLAGALYALGGYTGARAAIYVSRAALRDRPWFEPTALALSFGLLLSGPVVAHLVMLGARRVLPKTHGSPVMPGRRESAVAVLAALIVLTASPGHIQASEASSRSWEPQGSSSSPTSTSASGNSTPPNIILYVVDAVRHDHVSYYGYHRKTTPVFDRLAKQGVAFDDVHSTSSWSLPAAAGMLASRRAGTEASPGMLGAVLKGVTLPEVLDKHGYATLAVSNNPHVVGPYGVGQRFDKLDPGVPGWVIALNSTSLGLVRRRAFAIDDSDLANALIRRLDEMPQPFFTYIHVLGAHAPYEIPDGFEPAPTALGLATDDSASPPEGWVGVDLQPERGSPLPGQRFVLAEKSSGWRAVVGDRYKYMINTNKNKKWLFDRKTDPKERHNIANTKPKITKRMHAKLQQLVASQEPPLEADHSGEVNAALEERLRGLGYVE